MKLREPGGADSKVRGASRSDAAGLDRFELTAPRKAGAPGPFKRFFLRHGGRP